MTGELIISPNGIRTNGSSYSIIFNDTTTKNSYLGAQEATTYIRSGNTDLYHRRDGADYEIWDSGNSNLSTVNWSAKGITATDSVTSTSASLPNFFASVSAGNWAYVRLTSGSYSWDLAARDGNDSLEFRRGGADTDRFIFRSSASGGGDKSIELWRGSNASWKILNTGGILKFQSNYTTGVGTYYDVMKLDHNTGNAWFKGAVTLDSTLNVASTATFASTLGALSIGISNSDGTTGRGISLYGGPGGGKPAYGIMFAGTSTFGTHGSVTSDWATYFTMSDTTNRG